MGKVNKILFELLGDFCGKTSKQVEKDAARDFWLTADEAVKYGIIDEVIKTKNRVTKHNFDLKQKKQKISFYSN